MAGPRPDDAYDPTLKVDPSTSMPNNYLNVRASASDTGGQLGSAIEKGGKDLQNVENNATNIIVQRQGLANEHAATMAEVQLAVEGGDIYNKYKSQAGLDAANSKDAAIADYLKLNTKIRDSLGNPAAQRAYDQVSTRRLSFAIQDMNSYAAQQTKVAYKAGRTASMNLSIDEMSRPEVASDPRQFGAALGNTLFQANSLFTQDTYDTVPAKVDARTGRLQYDVGTEQGKIAQNDYDNYINTVLDKSYTNAAQSIAYSGQHPNPMEAASFIEANKDHMPPSTYAKLSHTLSSAVVGEQTRAIADDQIDSATSQFQNNPIARSSSLTGAFLDQESGNGATSTNKGQIQPETWKQFARADENINDPNDNETVTARILDKYNKDYNGDTARVAVAYFSGPGNVAPTGSKTPYINDVKDKNGKSVSSYVNDIGGRLGTSSSPVPSQADYLATHQDELIQGARDKAAKLGLDLAAQDAAAARTQTRISQVVSAERAQDRANENTIIKTINSGSIKFADDLTFSTDPTIKQAWIDLQARNPLFAQRVTENILPALAKGKPQTYGNSFWQNYLNVSDGKMDTTGLSGQVDPNNKNGALTTTGYDVLNKKLSAQETPEGHTFAQAEKEFLQAAQKRRVSGDPYGSNDNFNKYLAQALPQIEAAKKQGQADGKSMSQIAHDIFSPQIDGKPNPSYIRTSVTPPDPMALARQNASTFMFGQGSPSKTPPKDVPVTKLQDVHSKEDLLKFKTYHKLSSEELKQALQSAGMLKQ